MNLRPLLVIAAVTAPAASLAAPFADLATIDHAVTGFTGKAQGEPGGAALPVDRRLRLKPCAAPLALRWNGPRRDSVVVSCLDPGGWRLFVRVLDEGGEAAVPMIARGDAVTIAVTGAGFSVMQPGEALEAGAAGAWINVRPALAPAKAKAMRAQVVRPGLVRLPLP